MKKYFFYLLALLFILPAVQAQTITLEQCKESARLNYPLVKQFGLIEQSAKYSLSAANKAWLPQLSFSARASYQSDITELPPELGQAISKVTGTPFAFPSLTKDQYQAAFDVNQTIWDGGLVNAKKKEIKATAETEKQKLETDLYALNERVNQLFFGILLLNEQLVQNEILQNELKLNFDKITALKNNGIAGQTDIDMIKVEQIYAQQRETDITAARKSFIEMLGALTGLAITEKTNFTKPDFPKIDYTSTIQRPELVLFDSQKQIFDSQRDMILAGNMPKIGLFVQGGYGKPGLNMLTNDFSAFYIGGLRLSWNLSSFYTQKDNLNRIELGKKTVDVQKENFIFNIDLLNKQQQNEIEKLNTTLKNDDEIIHLRNNIKKSTEIKVENGIATVTDLLREINAESNARQTKLLHEIQLLMALYQYKNTTNN